MSGTHATGKGCKCIASCSLLQLAMLPVVRLLLASGRGGGHSQASQTSVNIVSVSSAAIQDIDVLAQLGCSVRGSQSAGVASYASEASARSTNSPDAAKYTTASSSSSTSALARAGSQQTIDDLALQNAPSQLLELIGDPRSGVADDVSSNPFGGVTVDMVHHQPSNEVYWYKYQFNQQREGHRDARLSEASRNLMYLLRAKDPARWTIDALAAKFRIRRQRVLAILALKEMEGQSMEAGQLMSGPLSAYACPVSTGDILLQQGSGSKLGEPVEVSSRVADELDMEAHSASLNVSPPSSVLKGPLPAASTSQQGATAHLPTIDSALLPLHNALPRASVVAGKLQAELLAALAASGFDLCALRTSIRSALDAADTQLAGAVPADLLSKAQGEGESQEGGDGGGETSVEPGSPDLEAVTQAVKALKQQRAAAEAALAALEGLLLQPPSVTDSVGDAAGGPPIAAEPSSDSSQPSQSTTQVQPSSFRSPLLEVERSATQATRALQAALKGEGTPDPEQVAAALGSLDPGVMLRAVLGLSPPLRGKLLDASPATAAALNTSGVDLSALRSSRDYAGPVAAADSSAGSDRGGSRMQLGGQLPVDVLGFQYISPEQYTALAQASTGLAAAEAAGQALQAGQGGPHAAEAAEGGQLVSDLSRLSSGYRSALWAAQELEAPGGEDQRVPRLTRAEVAQALRVMAEADPSMLERVQLVEAIKQLRRAGDHASAAQLRMKLRQLAGQPPLPGPQQQQELGDEGGRGEPGVVDKEAVAAAGRMAAGDSWPVVCAWLDTYASNKVYHRGSGERQVARAPTFPALEGYPLAVLDKVQEGELSALNRALGEVQEEALVGRFKSELLFNLGLRGEQVWDPSKPRTSPNLVSDWQSRPLVVYDIAQDGTTVYPPKYVVEVDGSRRPLNEQERVWQERRDTSRDDPSSRVHYIMRRIKSKPELH